MPELAWIFDLDGTLVDSLEGIAASLNAALADHRLPTHSLPSVRGFIGNGATELIRRASSSPDPAGIQAIEASFRLHYAALWPSGTREYPDITATLQALARRGDRLAVLSNKPDAFTRDIVVRCFPGIPFDPVIGQRDDQPRKPDPATALSICRHWQLPPDRCRFVGDSTVDLETARRAGIPFTAVTWGYHGPEDLLRAGASHLVHSAAELLA